MGIKTMFENKKDHEQCLNIYHSLTASKLVSDCSVPTIIKHQIAEYATGELSKCYYCRLTVSYLNGDNFEKDLFRINMDKEKGLICKQCHEKERICNFCNTKYKLSSTELCSSCFQPFCMNHCKTSFCRCGMERFCNKCSFLPSFQCNQCKATLCDGCREECVYGHYYCDTM